jgi:hypothetical protein
MVICFLIFNYIRFGKTEGCQLSYIQLARKSPDGGHQIIIYLFYSAADKICYQPREQGLKNAS